MIKFEWGAQDRFVMETLGGAARIWNALFDKYLKRPKNTL